MKNCTGKTCCEKALDMVTKMKDTCVRYDLGMNLEVFDKNTPETSDKQWKTQKNCTLSLFDLAIVGVAVIGVMVIGCCMGHHCKSASPKKEE